FIPEILTDTGDVCLFGFRNHMKPFWLRPNTAASD
ncbi:hypothetical protein ECFRIK1997_6168, partial [Escherichia coli FRIK1997]